jgi:hypothetical protein
LTTTVKRLNVDDLDAIPEANGGDRQESIAGVVVVSPPALEYQVMGANIVLAAREPSVAKRVAPSHHDGRG